ncbi:uncharacterized protein LOC119109248 [Pollicipes pollicipes]|uniref:uncharacterized protein LOC119109248 n=1 Tax=Pollicipes pollicipes TaxID=41117 RepID=UPI00188573E2|nr:uncharacterized protein LOC119109248 [Pollicipes pollicipes]
MDDCSLDVPKQVVMCDEQIDGVKQSAVEKDYSETGASENRDSAYGPSTNNQQSCSTGAASRECFSQENSALPSGSETSSLGKHRKSRLVQSAGSSSAQSSEKPSNRLTTRATTDSEEGKSAEGAGQGTLHREAYQHVISYIRKIVQWEKGMV